MGYLFENMEKITGFIPHPHRIRPKARNDKRRGKAATDVGNQVAR